MYRPLIRLLHAYTIQALRLVAKKRRVFLIQQALLPPDQRGVHGSRRLRDYPSMMGPLQPYPGASLESIEEGSPMPKQQLQTGSSWSLGRKASSKRSLPIRTAGRERSSSSSLRELPFTFGSKSLLDRIGPGTAERALGSSSSIIGAGVTRDPGPVGDAPASTQLSVDNAALGEKHEASDPQALAGELQQQINALATGMRTGAMPSQLKSVLVSQMKDGARRLGQELNRRDQNF